MGISSLGYMGFEVSDLDAWKPFMENFLGLMRGAETKRSVKYRMDSRAWRIAVEKGAKDDISFVGLEVDTPAGLEILKARLTARDIPYTEGDDELKARRDVRDLIVTADPAGLTVEIYVGATELTQQPFASPAAVSGFHTGDQGAGHIVLASDNIDDVRAFYVDTLGFRMSDTIGIALGPDFTLLLEFYHCNPRHHTLALAGVAGPKRIHHFMVEMAGLDDVGYAQDRMEACKVKATMTLGKHSNDRMVSFYASTPSGFDVEVGCAGIPVYDEEWRVTHHKVTSMWGHKPVA